MPDRLDPVTVDLLQAEDQYDLLLRVYRQIVREKVALSDNLTPQEAEAYLQEALNDPLSDPSAMQIAISELPAVTQELGAIPSNQVRSYLGGRPPAFARPNEQTQALAENLPAIAGGRLRPVQTDQRDLEIGRLFDSRRAGNAFTAYRLLRQQAAERAAAATTPEQAAAIADAGNATLPMELSSRLMRPLGGVGLVPDWLTRNERSSTADELGRAFGGSKSLYSLPHMLLAAGASQVADGLLPETYLERLQRTPISDFTVQEAERLGAGGLRQLLAARDSGSPMLAERANQVLNDLRARNVLTADNQLLNGQQQYEHNRGRLDAITTENQVSDYLADLMRAPTISGPAGGILDSVRGVGQGGLRNALSRAGTGTFHSLLQLMNGMEMGAEVGGEYIDRAQAANPALAAFYRLKHSPDQAQRDYYQRLANDPEYAGIVADAERVYGRGMSPTLPGGAAGLVSGLLAGGASTQAVGHMADTARALAPHSWATRLTAAGQRLRPLATTVRRITSPGSWARGAQDLVRGAWQNRGNIRGTADFMRTAARARDLQRVQQAGQVARAANGLSGIGRWDAFLHGSGRAGTSALLGSWAMDAAQNMGLAAQGLDTGYFGGGYGTPEMRAWAAQDLQQQLQEIAAAAQGRSRAGSAAQGVLKPVTYITELLGESQRADAAAENAGRAGLTTDRSMADRARLLVNASDQAQAAQQQLQDEFQRAVEVLNTPGISDADYNRWLDYAQQIDERFQSGQSINGQQILDIAQNDLGPNQQRVLDQGAVSRAAAQLGRDYTQQIAAESDPRLRGWNTSQRALLEQAAQARSQFLSDHGSTLTDAWRSITQGPGRTGGLRGLSDQQLRNIYLGHRNGLISSQELQTITGGGGQWNTQGDERQQRINAWKAGQQRLAEAMRRRDLPLADWNPTEARAAAEQGYIDWGSARNAIGSRQWGDTFQPDVQRLQAGPTPASQPTEPVAPTAASQQRPVTDQRQEVGV